MPHVQQDNPPDIRLAKAFKFSHDDLLANRQGLVSVRQRGLTDWLAFRLLFMLRHAPIVGGWFSGSMSGKKPTHSIRTVCGRIRLDHHIVDKRLIRSTLFYEYYHLVFPGHNQIFRLSRDQFRALTTNLKYRAYYQEFGEQRHILSIERIIGNCDG